jgi:uncharacterized protein (TIGR03083 family)
VKDPDLSTLYAQTRDRLAALVSGLDDAALATPVPACPKWTVRDVIAHLAAVAEDVLAGRLTRPPGEEQTDAQVARFAGCGLGEIVAHWESNAPAFEKLVGTAGIWPAVMDVASHEQDIRGALGLPGARDTDVIRQSAGQLLSWLRTPVPVRVRVEDAEFRSGPAADAGPVPGAVPELALSTTRFEAFRWRLGRRSRAQLAALDWSGDPAPVLDHLVVFGPSPRDIIE